MQLLAFDSPGSETLATVTLALTKAGLEVTWSFDLQSAMARGSGCACPYHGKTLCDCEYMVLLVYDEGSAPATLVIHGSGERSWAVMPHSPDDADLQAAIIASLSRDTALVDD